jgi:hypothetical protein
MSSGENSAGNPPLDGAGDGPSNNNSSVGDTNIKVEDETGSGADAGGDANADNAIGSLTTVDRAGGPAADSAAGGGGGGTVAGSNAAFPNSTAAVAGGVLYPGAVAAAMAGQQVPPYFLVAGPGGVPMGFAAAGGGTAAAAASAGPPNPSATAAAAMINPLLFAANSPAMLAATGFNPSFFLQNQQLPTAIVMAGPTAPGAAPTAAAPTAAATGAPDGATFGEANAPQQEGGATPLVAQPSVVTATPGTMLQSAGPGGAATAQELLRTALLLQNSGYPGMAGIPPAALFGMVGASQPAATVRQQQQQTNVFEGGAPRDASVGAAAATSNAPTAAPVAAVNPTANADGSVTINQPTVATGVPVLFPGGAMATMMPRQFPMGNVVLNGNLNAGPGPGTTMVIPNNNNFMMGMNAASLAALQQQVPQMFAIQQQQQPLQLHQMQQQQQQQVSQTIGGAPSTATSGTSVAASAATAGVMVAGSAASPQRQAIPLYLDHDENCLTAYQCFLRKQIELFEAGKDELHGTAQGRNTPLHPGQVGIRCRHCAHLPKAARARGGVYYSRTVDGVCKCILEGGAVLSCVLKKTQRKIMGGPGPVA